MRKLVLTILAAGVALLATSAGAADFLPAVVYDMGGKFDKSFNQAAYDGAERFKSETGIEYREFEVTNPSQREQAIRNMARRGATIVIGIGFAQAAAVEKVAKEFPDVKFTLIDGVVELPNVQSVIFISVSRARCSAPRSPPPPPPLSAARPGSAWARASPPRSRWP